MVTNIGILSHLAAAHRAPAYTIKRKGKLGPPGTGWVFSPQVSHPGRQVISMSGDGGFAMLMGDPLTLRQHELPVKLRRQELKHEFTSIV